ncbi:MAG: helix-turn-helix transcriptional regulator [Parafilimonas sp.]
MNVQFYYPDGKPVIFQEIDRRQYRGLLLPGSQVQQSHLKAARITVQQFKEGAVGIGHILLEIFSKIRLLIQADEGVRLEALLSGDTYITHKGSKRKFRAGEYRITDEPSFRALFKKNTACHIFICCYPAELLATLGIEIDTCPPMRMPDSMMNLIQAMLRNTYTTTLLNFYYENCMRELLFFHLASHSEVLPGSLTDKDADLIYQTDAFIAANLQEHYSIETLARLMHTNSLKLKVGFNKVYGMGVFERLIYRRMEQAKRLLETTDKQVKEIAGITGYASTAAFIHAFRKRFGLTPREWQQQAKSDNRLQEEL